MKKEGAFRKAFRVWRGNPGASFRFLLTELCLTLLTLAPLLFLAESGLRFLALLTVPLFLLVILPARVNAAAAMQDALAGGSLFSRVLGDPSHYWKKLGYGLSRCGLLLLWGAPLAASLIIAREHISGEMDGFTLLRMIKSFGGGDLLTGVMYLALILLGTLLLLAFGCAFHCGDRHALVLRPARVRRGKMIGAWFGSLLALLPLLAALAVLVVRYMPSILDLDGVVMGLSSLPSTRVSLIILAVGAVLTVPLLPLRSLIIAACAGGEERE